MIASFRSELVKLRRFNTVLGYVGAATGFAVLVTVVSIINADDPNAGGPGNREGIGVDRLAEPGGYLAGFEAASGMLGIIALALFAVAVATEFSTGTVRTLLTMDARRRSLLMGKIAGLAAFWAAAVTVAAVICMVTAGLFAGSQGIDTAAWATADGIVEGLAIWVNVTIATVIWGLFGAALAMLSRSTAIAIAAGIGYFLIGERLILHSLWPSTADWLPAGSLDTLAAGGSPTVGFVTALAFSLLYGAAAYLATSVIFERRDVTD